VDVTGDPEFDPGVWWLAERGGMLRDPTGAVRLYELRGFVTAGREAVWPWRL